MKQWPEAATYCARSLVVSLVMVTLCASGCVVVQDSYSDPYGYSDDDYYREQAERERYRYEEERARRIEAERRAQNQTERLRLERERRESPLSVWLLGRWRRRAGSGRAGRVSRTGLSSSP